MIVPFFNEKCALPLKNKEIKTCKWENAKFLSHTFFGFFLFVCALYTHKNKKKQKNRRKEKKA
jgi:hypothetical protein